MTLRPAPHIKSVAGRHRLLYVMAAQAEYGPHLQARFTPLMTGVGPVEAAVALAGALAALEHAGALPHLVVSLGSAGSRTLEQTGVYQASSVSYRDMDASPLGFEKGATPFLDLPAVVPLPVRVPGIAPATLSTGANIVSGAAYEAIAADMVDMETFAVLRACQFFGVPLVALRGISDGAAELKHVGDWTEYLHVIDEKLAAAVDRLEAAVVGGLLSSPRAQVAS
jgi:adenosylhomocysteine nucleosidase